MKYAVKSLQIAMEYINIDNIIWTFFFLSLLSRLKVEKNDHLFYVRVITILVITQQGSC